MSKKLSYHKIVNYDVADPAKVLAQKEGRATASNMPFGYSELEGTRGESAYVFDMGDRYGALVQEGLGTKSLVAQAVYAQTGESHFAAIAKDTVSTFINDLVSVGATPVVSNAYWSSSSYDWLADKKLTTDFIRGWRAACDEAGVVWGGGETQALSQMVVDGALEFAGSVFGVISPKTQLVTEKNLKAGDAIIVVESSGVHANGLSLIREIASQLPDSYQTKLPSGITFGEAVLRPTHLYAKLVRALFAADIDVHYLSNITGHGWRKLMRATSTFTYRITNLPDVDEIFPFIQKYSGNTTEEMYSNYNMGAGYAIYIKHGEELRATEVITALGLKCWVAGRVEEGEKQVIIEPLEITFASESLAVR